MPLVRTLGESVEVALRFGEVAVTTDRGNKLAIVGKELDKVTDDRGHVVGIYDE